MNDNVYSQTRNDELRNTGSKRLILTGTNKGGTGRTFLMLLLWDWLQAMKVRVATADCDWHSASLTRFLPDSFFFDLAQPDSVDQLLGAFEENDVVLLDGPGIQHPRYWEWMFDSGLFQMMETNGYGITVALTIEEDKDTVFQAAQAAEAIGASAAWLVVQNLKTSESTTIYEKSATRLQLLKMGAQHIVLDRLPWSTLAKLQQMSRTVGALIQDPSVSMMEKQRLKNYQTRVFKEFQATSKLLLPEMATSYRHRSSAERSDMVRPKIAPAEV